MLSRPRYVESSIVGASVLLTACSLTSLLPQAPFLLEIAVSFKPFLLILTTVSLLYFIANKKKLIAIICFFASLVNAVDIGTWYLPSPVAHATHGNPLRVFLLNVYYRNYEHEQVIRLVRKSAPDIALFTEASDHWTQPLSTLQDILPYSYPTETFHEKSIRLMSRYPLQNPQVKYFGGFNRPNILANINYGGQTISLVGVHFVAPVTSARLHLRNLELHDLSQYLATTHSPAIVFGDLNTTMWSPEYHKLVAQTGLINSRQGFGIMPSWISPLPFLTAPIDHIFVKGGVEIVHLERLPAIGSDHLPLLALLHTKELF